MVASPCIYGDVVPFLVKIVFLCIFVLLPFICSYFFSFVVVVIVMLLLLFLVSCCRIMLG